MGSLSADPLAFRAAAPEARCNPAPSSRLHARVSAAPAASLACSRSAAFSGEKLPASFANAASCTSERRAAPRHAPSTARRGPVRTEAVLKSVQELLGGARGGSGGSSGDGGPLDCVVVGGGISGLCAALALETEHGEAAPRVMVTEAKERVGGNITTVDGGNGYLWEEGPNSFQPNDSMLKCAADAGVLPQLVLGDPTAPRFVFWEGRLRPVPGGLADLPFFTLLSPLGKIRAGLGALGLRPGPPADGREESVEEFVRRNLGAEVFERLIEPFCSGVYAGDPSRLSMKAAFGKVWRLEDIGGSIIGGSLKLLQDKKNNPPPPRDPRLPKPKGQTVGSFQKGLITLPKAIAEKLGDKVKVQWKLSSLRKREDGLLELTYDTPQGQQTLLSRSVLLTMPSYVAADVLQPLSGEAAEALRSFYYPPVAAVTISYPVSAFKPDRLTDGELKGFGQLHPRSQGIVTLGTIYSSSLFPGRAPEGRVLLLCYIGGSTNEKIKDMDEKDIVATVDKDLRKMLLHEDAPAPQTQGVRVWPRAIPQFLVGHGDTLAKARRGMDAAGLEGVFLGGNYVAGVALGRCVEGGYESAKEVATFLAAQPVVAAVAAKSN